MEDYNHYISNFELMLVNLFDIFGVPDYCAIEDTIDQVNKIYEKSIRKEKAKELLERGKNIIIDNKNLRRWTGYGIATYYKGTQRIVELQELKRI